MKKALALTLALVMLLFTFSACGGSKTEAAAPADAGKTEAAAPADAGTAAPASEGVAGYTAENPMKVAFVYHGVTGDFGWFYNMDKARVATNEALDWVNCEKIENVAVGTDAARVFEDLCNDGYKVIVAGSLDYQADIQAVASNHPDVAFLIASGGICDTNIESFFPRHDGVWYVLGQVAAYLSESGKIGVVGSLPNCLTVTCIADAWTLGAQSINPDIEVDVIYVNSFDDPAAERDAALSLIEVGCDVIMQGTNNAAHVQACEEKGVYCMSQWEDMSSYGPTCYVSGERFNWDAYFCEVFPQIASGEWTGRIYYPDYASHGCEILPFYIDLPQELLDIVAETEAKLEEDQNFFYVGPIYDAKGNLRIAFFNESAATEIYTEVDWHVQGIVSSVD